MANYDRKGRLSLYFRGCSVRCCRCHICLNGLLINERSLMAYQIFILGDTLNSSLHSELQMICIISYFADLASFSFCNLLV